MSDFWKHFKINQVISLFEVIEENFLFEDIMNFSVLP